MSENLIMISLSRNKNKTKTPDTIASGVFQCFGFNVIRLQIHKGVSSEYLVSPPVLLFACNI